MSFHFACQTMSERPKLNLAPRSAAGALPLRRPSGTPSPFGAARPREAIIAERTGVAEADVLKQDAATYIPKLRLRRRRRTRGTSAQPSAQARRTVLTRKTLGCPLAAGTCTGRQFERILSEKRDHLA